MLTGLAEPFIFGAHRQRTKLVLRSSAERELRVRPLQPKGRERDERRAFFAWQTARSVSTRAIYLAMHARNAGLEHDIDDGHRKIKDAERGFSVHAHRGGTCIEAAARATEIHVSHFSAEERDRSDAGQRFERRMRLIEPSGVGIHQAICNDFLAAGLYVSLPYCTANIQTRKIARHGMAR